MRDFLRLSLTDAAARIRGDVDTLILFHRRPDGDAVGSGFALCGIVEAMGGRALCVCADELPDRLRFLVGDRQASVLHSALPADFTPAQIITVDTASPAQMGELCEIYRDRVDLMIDHHGMGEMYADGWICPEAAATGEMIYALACELLRMGRLPTIPKATARLLYAAISADTGCFRFNNASPAAHRAAADLLEMGIDAADVNHRLFVIKSEKLLLAEKLGLERLQLFSDGRIGIVDIPFAVKRENGLSDEHMETLVDIPRCLASVQVAVAIRQSADAPVYRVSMRSSSEVDVAAICATFGGGGHVRAAGCTITCEGGSGAVIRLVVEAIERML